MLKHRHQSVGPSGVVVHNDTFYGSGLYSGGIAVSNNNWATARSGSGAYVPLTPGFLECRASYYAPTYYLAEGFFGFDTSSIPGGATILAATFSICLRNKVGSFTLELAALLFGSLSAADWQDTTELSALSILGSLNTSGMTVNNYSDISGVESGVVKGGISQYVLWPQRIRTAAAPAGGEYIEYWSDSEADPSEYRPRLQVSWSA